MTRFTAFLLSAVLVLSACNWWSTESSTDSELNAFLAGLVTPPPPPAPPTDPIILQTGINLGYSGRDRCEDTRMNETVTPSQLTSFAPLADVLAPGQVVSGESISQGVLTPLGLPLAAQKLVVTDIGIADSGQPIPEYTTTVRKPSVATTTQGIQALLQGLVGLNTPARITEGMSTYYSLDHAALKLDASAHWMSGGVKATLDRANYTSQSNVLVSFVQSYYSVSVVAPASGDPASMFRGVSVPEMRASLHQSTTMPAYVSTVTYGRIILLSASASVAESDLRATLQVVVNGIKAGGQISLSYEEQQIVDQSDFRMVAIGGSASDAVTITNGAAALQQLSDLYASGANWGSDSPGIAISYQLRWLGTNDEARMTFTTDYDVRGCRPQQVTGFGIRFETVDDNKDAGDIVSGEVYSGSELVASDNEIGDRGHEWDEHTQQPDPSDASWGGIPGWFLLPVSSPNPPTIDGCRAFTLRIMKTGGRGWRFSPYLMAVLEDGSIIGIPIPSLYNNQTPWQLGNGQVSSRDFGAQGC